MNFENIEELNKSDGPLFKIEHDPRILKGLSLLENLVLMNYLSLLMS